MNRERILELADRIERTPHARQLDVYAQDVRPRHFNMSSWHCGTAACIGGWAEAMYFPKDDNPAVSEVYDALGLSRTAGENLFFGETSPDITPKQAATCLRNLAKTGKVNWKKALAA